MKPFTIAACQVRAFDIEDAEENLAGLLRALDEAGRAGAQLVLLPECAYPAYYLKTQDPYAVPGVRPYDEVCRLFGGKAKEYGYWLAAGMAVPHGDGRVSNSGVVFDPSGAVVGRYDKSFLWHFDTHWFERGRAFPVFDAGFCRFGVLICADGRQPEIARMLRVNGAELICDLTAWVSWGRTTAELSTTQCEYLMPVRAFENGVWVAAADKWGPEDETLIYAGRSTIIDPTGATRVCAPSTGDTVVTYEMTPMDVESVPRRPSQYGLLTQPTVSLPVLAYEDAPLVPSRAHGRVAVVPGEPGGWDIERTVRRYAALRSQDCDLVVFGGAHGNDGWEVDLPQLERAVHDLGGAAMVAVATTGCNLKQSAALVTAGRTYEHVATHGRGIDLGEAPAPIVETGAGRVAMVVGDEMAVPEVPRMLALQGADVLAWSSFEAHGMNERFSRCRSDESRVYTAAAWPDGGAITNPEGATMIAVPAGTGVAMAVAVSRSHSRWKERAPGTHVIRDRVPEAYGKLTS